MACSSETKIRMRKTFDDRKNKLFFPVNIEPIERKFSPVNEPKKKKKKYAIGTHLIVEHN
jgi:hypothetical protein